MQAVLVLMEALHSVKELEPVTTSGDNSIVPLELLIFFLDNIYVDTHLVVF